MTKMSFLYASSFVAMICVLAPASADILVLESSVPGVKRGAQLPDSGRLVVPAGKSVMVMRPSGETQNVVGPYDNLVGDLSKGETISDAFRRMKAQFDKESGGLSIGATRGVPKK
jgi:hypothetical protein